MERGESSAPVSGRGPTSTGSYRLGLGIVLVTIAVSALLVLIFSRRAAEPARASQDLGGNGFALGQFSLKERSGRAVTDRDLAEQTWIAAFIFTRCPLSCPRITGVMKDLQEKLAGSGVRLVSISVDPEFDTPEVLKTYAERFGADPERWWFLTGGRETIFDLIEKRFRLSVAMPTPEDRQKGAEAVLHSDRLALVDGNRVVGYFDSTDTVAIARLLGDARHRALPSWVLMLPSVNASLNALCAIMLIGGWVKIRGAVSARPVPDGDEIVRLRPDPVSGPSYPRQVLAHQRCMIAAVITSAVFLGCYLLYHYFAGSVAFRGTGAVRAVYLTILLSHTILATFGVVPLVSITLIRALKGDFARHARIARVTFPIWLYVSITGVVIYLMLYHLPVAESTVVAAMP